MLNLPNKILSIIVVLGVIPFFYACSDDSESNVQTQKVDNRSQKEKLEEFNKNLVVKEKNNIDDYIQRSGNVFAETGTGLRYCIVNQGNGDLIKTGEIVTMEYEELLLNGKMLYSSKETGPKVFLVGRGGVESGLEEAVLYLRRGDEAEIIIPSRLAHGLTGDGDRVPSNSTIVYRIKIIDNQIIN